MKKSASLPALETAGAVFTGMDGQGSMHDRMLNSANYTGFFFGRAPY
jgi:hypothetical protein